MSDSHPARPTLRPGLTAAALASTVAVGLAAVGAYGAITMNGPRRPALDYTFTPFELGETWEDVSFLAADDTRLVGWWMEDAASDHVIVVSHGHRGDKSQMLGIGTGLHRAGASVLLYDFRGSGGSADGPQSLAHYEQQDLRAAIAWVRTRRPRSRISLVGFSMGAAVSLLVAAGDAGVERVLADSAFADARGVVETAAAGMRAPRALAGPISLASRALHGYGLDEVRPVDAIGKIAPRPVLLLHSAEDLVVPIEHAHRLAAAAGPTAVLEVTPDAGHCGSYFADRPGYIARAAEFLMG